MNENPSGGHIFLCTSCGAANRADAKACFLCGQPHDPDKSTANLAEVVWAPVKGSTQPFNPYAPPAAAAADSTTFELSSLMLVIALIAVCLGVTVEAPGMGVPMAIIATIALGRTSRFNAHYRTLGTRLSVGEKLAIFMSTVAIVYLVIIAGIVAFVVAFSAICAMSMAGDTPIAVIAVVVGIAIFFALSALIRWLARVKPRRPAERSSPEDFPLE